VLPQTGRSLILKDEHEGSERLAAANEWLIGDGRVAQHTDSVNAQESGHVDQALSIATRGIEISAEVAVRSDANIESGAREPYGKLFRK
jgi:hypothetical protein